MTVPFSTHDCVRAAHDAAEPDELEYASAAPARMPVSPYNTLGLQIQHLTSEKDETSVYGLLQAAQER